VLKFQTTLLTDSVASNQFFLNNSKTVSVTTNFQENKNVPNQLLNSAP